MTSEEQMAVRKQPANAFEERDIPFQRRLQPLLQGFRHSIRVRRSKTTKTQLNFGWVFV
jgi:hypothetical protein